MSAMSNYLEGKLIDQIFRGQAAPTTSTLYIGLFNSAAPGEANTSGTEITINGTTNYVRASVASSTANWAATTQIANGSGQTSNSGSITFQTPGVGGWGLVVAFGVYDGPTPGTSNLLFYGNLTIQKTINEGDTVSFPAGTLQVAFN
jgi:hypothetical protein